MEQLPQDHRIRKLGLVCKSYTPQGGSSCHLASASWVSDALLGPLHGPAWASLRVLVWGMGTLAEAQRDHQRVQGLSEWTTEPESPGDNNCDGGSHLLSTYCVSVPFTLRH